LDEDNETDIDDLKTGVKASFKILDRLLKNEFKEEKKFLKV